MTITITQPSNDVISFEEAAARLRGMSTQPAKGETPSAEPKKSRGERDGRGHQRNKRKGQSRDTRKRTPQKRQLPGLNGRTPVTNHKFTDEQVAAFESQIDKMEETEGWTNPDHRAMVDTYITSLLNGLVYVPKGLCETTRRKVARAFMIFCDEQEPRIGYKPMRLDYGFIG